MMLLNTATAPGIRLIREFMEYLHFITMAMHNMMMAIFYCREVGLQIILPMVIMMSMEIIILINMKAFNVLLPAMAAIPFSFILMTSVLQETTSLQELTIQVKA